MASSGATVLVAEDDEDIRDFLSTALEHWNYAVLMAPNGDAALEILRQQPADLLITDIVMPGGLNGVRLVEEAYKVCPDIKAICMSGYPKNTHPDDFRRVCSHFLPKPFTADDLREALRTLGC